MPFAYPTLTHRRPHRRVSHRYCCTFIRVKVLITVPLLEWRCWLFSSSSTRLVSLAISAVRVSLADLSLVSICSVSTRFCLAWLSCSPTSCLASISLFRLDNNTHWTFYHLVCLKLLWKSYFDINKLTSDIQQYTTPINSFTAHSHICLQWMP